MIDVGDVVCLVSDFHNTRRMTVVADSGTFVTVAWWCADEGTLKTKNTPRSVLSNSPPRVAACISGGQSVAQLASGSPRLAVAQEGAKGRVYWWKGSELLTLPMEISLKALALPQKPDEFGTDDVMPM